MRRLLILAAVLPLSACGLLYRTPVVQGNIVPTAKVAQLHTGMTRKQVRYLLGTPLVAPGYQRDRMNYVFYYRNPRGHVRKSKLVLYFEGKKLARIEGDEEYRVQVQKDDATDQSGA